MINESINWAQLKEFCNGLTEEQLKEKVILWREEECLNRIYTFELHEDYYIEIDGDDLCMTETEMQYEIDRSPEYYPKGRKHFKKVYSKGRPMLGEDF